jgi:hypothetical protein
VQLGAVDRCERRVGLPTARWRKSSLYIAYISLSCLATHG